MIFNSLFTAAGDGAATGSILGSVLSLGLPIIGFIILYYFLFSRPQKKQDQERKDLLDNLKVGDEITTIGGIIGAVVSIKDETVVIETTRERTKIRILRSAIRSIDVHADEADNAEK